jgi:phosphomannomutase
LTLLAVLDAYAEAKVDGKTFGQMMKPYIKYQQTEDVVVFVKDRELAFKKTEAFIRKMKPERIKNFDGRVIDFGNVWGVLKMSVTEYALKLMFESAKKKDAQIIQDKIEQYIESIADASK